MSVIADAEGGRIVIRGAWRGSRFSAFHLLLFHSGAERADINALHLRTDTGIGMTKEQLEENLGTIARSGTSEFLETIESKNAEGANLIGQVRHPVYRVAPSCT